MVKARTLLLAACLLYLAYEITAGSNCKKQKAEEKGT
jgi:hypothetical protein